MNSQLQSANTAISKHNEGLMTNSSFIQKELNWLSEIIDDCLSHYFEKDMRYCIDQLPPPDIIDRGTASIGSYADFIVTHNLSNASRLILILSLCTHIQPKLLDTFTLPNKLTGRRYSEFGGVLDSSNNIFTPTVETALFLLTTCNVQSRLEHLTQFESNTPLFKLGVINLQTSEAQCESLSSSKLSINQEWLTKLLLGHDKKPTYSRAFPAQLLQSKLEWKDLVLNSHTEDELNHLLTWALQSNTIMQDWNLQGHIKPGYRALFYGPPGTGKTLSASLLGKQANLDVYRIDLSSLVSKYIGETEKNLAAVFDQAEQQSWILFFDEADALFSKRSGGASSNDRHSNQEIAYLLQRMEVFDGIVILATNLKTNMDEAFNRRFQSVIFFPMPDAKERLALWKSILDDADIDTSKIDLKDLANQYELSGGAMINAVRFAAIKTLQQDKNSITQSDLELGITRELRKEGKFVS